MSLNESQPVDPSVAALQAENEALRRQLSSEKRVRVRRTRTVGSWVTAVIAILITSLALLTIWTFRTLNNPDLFVERVGSVIEEPEVAAAVGEVAAEVLVTELDLQQRLSEALPEPLALAAAPITNAAQGYLAEGATRLVETEGFQAAWDDALRAGHKLTIGVLSGTDTTVVDNTDGVIVLNLTPVINELVAEGADFLSELLGRDIGAPTVSSDDIDAAVDALASELNVDLPDDFGQIVLFQSDDLAASQRAYQAAETAAWLAPLAALLLIALALVVAVDRLRVFLAILVGTALTMMLVAIATQPLQTSIVNAAAASGLDGAVQAGFESVLSSLRTGILVVVFIGFVAAVVMFFTGRSRAAARSREVAGRVPSLAVAHRGLFLAAGFGVALLVIVLIPGQSWGQLGFTLLLYGVFAFAVLLAQPSESAAEPGGDSDPDAQPTAADVPTDGYGRP